MKGLTITDKMIADIDICKEILSTMKDINVIDKVVTIKSSMKDDTVVAMKELAKEIVG